MQACAGGPKGTQRCVGGKAKRHQGPFKKIGHLLFFDTASPDVLEELSVDGPARAFTRHHLVSARDQQRSEHLAAQGTSQLHSAWARRTHFVISFARSGVNPSGLG